MGFDGLKGLNFGMRLEHLLRCDIYYEKSEEYVRIDFTIFWLD